MTPYLITACILLVLAIGGIVFIFMKAQQQKSKFEFNLQALELKMEEKARYLAERANQFGLLQKELEETRQRVEDREQARAQLSERLVELQTELDMNKKSHEEKLELLRKGTAEMEARFENLANKIFEEKNSAFLSKNKAGLDGVINPFKENLVKLEERINEVYTQEMRDRASLKENVKTLGDLNDKVFQEVTNLTRALKGDNKKQGNWGEMVLRRLLEESGLEEGREFFTEKSFPLEDGKRSRPDVIIRLPENKDVIVDSKVSLVSYERFVNAESEPDRNQAIKELKLSITSHIKNLNGKDYDGIESLNSPGFVLMFLPNESAYLTVLREDSSLFDTAFSQKILIVGPSTLWAVLKIIDSIWLVQRQNENTREIVEQANKLLDKYRLFMESFESIGDRVDKARDAYQLAKNRFSSGKGNLLSTANRLVELGARVKKGSLPKFLEEEEMEPLAIEQES